MGKSVLGIFGGRRGELSWASKFDRKCLGSCLNAGMILLVSAVLRPVSIDKPNDNVPGGRWESEVMGLVSF